MKAKKIASVLMLIGMFAVVALLSSCDKSDDELRIPLGASLQMDSVNQSSVSELRSSKTTAWSNPEWFDGMRRYEKYFRGRRWHVLKVYLPKISVRPVYRIANSSDSSNPTFYKMDLDDWRNVVEGRNALALVNASFFNLKKFSFTAYDFQGSLAEVAHPFGFRNWIVSKGYASGEAGQKVLHIKNFSAYIDSYSSPFSRYDVMVVGLDPLSCDKDKNLLKGRTIIGIPNNGSNLLYVFVTGKGGGATQAEAVQALREFGCKRFLMLDGSGSSQMVWNNRFIVEGSDPTGNRNVPIILRMDRY